MGYNIDKMASGSLKYGPNLYARRCEGGYELWISQRKIGRTDPWNACGVVESMEAARAWLLSWGKDMYTEVRR